MKKDEPLLNLTNIAKVLNNSLMLIGFGEINRNCKLKQ